MTRPRRPAQLHRVVNAEVETKPAERIVDVRDIAGEEHAALAKRSRHPLIHIIEVAVHDFVAARLGNELLQAALDRFVGEQLSFALLEPGR